MEQGQVGEDFLAIAERRHAYLVCLNACCVMT
jgi:hypothetical protein